MTLFCQKPSFVISGEGILDGVLEEWIYSRMPEDTSKAQEIDDKVYEMIQLEEAKWFLELLVRKLTSSKDHIPCGIRRLYQLAGSLATAYSIETALLFTRIIFDMWLGPIIPDLLHRKLLFEYYDEEAYTKWFSALWEVVRKIAGLDSITERIYTSASNHYISLMTPVCQEIAKGRFETIETQATDSVWLCFSQECVTNLVTLVNNIKIKQKNELFATCAK